MVSTRSPVGVLSRHALGAGLLAAAAALFVALLSQSGLGGLGPVSPGPSATEATFLDRVGSPAALVLAPIAALVVGTLVWRWVVPPGSSRRRGAAAGGASALGTVVAVPLLFGLYVLVLFLGLGLTPANDRGLDVALVTAARGSLFVTWTLTLHWSLPVGAVLVPLGAALGWAYERTRGSPRGG
jgi:hypothetical protein